MKPKADYLKSPGKAFLFAISTIKGRFLIMLTLIVIGDVLGDLLPYYFKVITDKVSVSSTNLTFHDFIIPLVAIIVVLIVHEIAFRIGHVIETYIAPEAFKHITTNLYQGLIKRPTSYFENKFSGDLGRRIEQIGTATLYFVENFPWQFGWMFISVIMAAVLLSLTSVYILIAFILWLVFFLVTAVPLLRWHYRLSGVLANSHANLSGSIIDSLGNIPLVHSFGGVNYEQELNLNTVDSVIKVERKVRWASICNKLQAGLSIAILGISLTWISIVLFVQRSFTVGDFIIVAATIPSLIGVVWSFSDIILQASHNFGQMADAVKSLHENQEQLLGGNVEKVKAQEYSVDFKNISFQYPGTNEPVFSKFSLNINQGQHVGIVGTSGAGKSTLIKLLLRQYSVQKGEVAIGKIPVEKFTLEAFNKLISYVPQDTSLFHRTLFENIQYANPTASKEEVLEASKKAHAEEFIISLPEKYDTKVGERGIKLSGGQRQRIALARAILKNAPILVLDEATSSLDTESETVIQESLAELFQNRTVIAIAHRLSTLRAMDQIMVMEDGAIVESGNPQDLLNSEDSIFKHMWEQQKNGFI